MKLLLRYFIRGLVFIIPFLITVYVIYSSITWIDDLVPSVFKFRSFPGEGVILVLSITTLLGYLGSTIIAKSVFQSFEYYIYKIPLINLIYSSTKDIVGAIVGDGKKFNQPVLVKWNSESEACRIGFITQNDLTYLKLEGKVAVYFPDSYNISGNLFIVPKEHVQYLNVNSSEIMKFVVSGGIAGFYPETNSEVQS